MNAAAKIIELIKRSTGLDAGCYGATTFNSVVMDRFRSSGLPTLRDYHRHLERSADARRELIEALVVLETWFFRGRESFEALTNWVRAEWLPANAGVTLRLLSVPCATGEEPYSLAMTLLDAGLSARSFRIDAVDISARAIAVARQATYRKNSFREKRLDFRERFFWTVDGHDVLRGAVRRTVNFRVGNVIEADFPADAGRYHVIFCRNLLIYFDRPTQRRVIESCRTWLAPGGVLFVGHAEAAALAEHGFTPLKHPKTFGFRKGEGKNAGTCLSSAAMTTRDPSRLNLAKAGLRSRRRQAANVLDQFSRNIPDPALPSAGGKSVVAMNRHLATTLAREAANGSVDDCLREVQRLADQGRLPEAAALCQAHLRDEGASASAFFWLGMVHDAAGQPESASDCYRKAVYLQPDHTDALWHLALLAEKVGDAAQARGWRRRAERVAERSRR